MVSSQKTKILTVAITGILLLLLLNVFQEKTRSFFYSISFPFQRVLWQAGRKTSGLFNGLFDIQDLEKENQILKLKNQELSQKVIALRDLEKENEDLRKALNLGLEKDFKLVMGEIIEKDISQDFVLINKGSENGISKGMPVITAQRALVGRIEKAYRNFSRVSLISNKKSSFDAAIGIREGKRGEKDKITGMVKGNGNLALHIDFLPFGQEVFANEFVFTNSLGGIFPKDLLVGQIEKVGKSDVDSSQRADIKPAFNIRELDNLFVISEY